MAASGFFTQFFTWLGELAGRGSTNFGARGTDRPGGYDRDQGTSQPAPLPTQMKPAPVHGSRFPSPPAAAPESSRVAPLAWGARVSAPFKRKVIAMASRLDMSPDHLMAVMAFETGRSFDPAIRNHAGSGATGLIQFMPRTAMGLGTTTQALSKMSALAQLDYVEAYLRPYKGRMRDLSSAYMAVLYPRAVGRADDYVLFRKGSKAYKLNRGLDRDNNGQVTKAEASARVEAILEEGLLPRNLG